MTDPAAAYTGLRTEVERLAAPGRPVTKTAVRSLLDRYPPLSDEGDFADTDFSPTDFA